MKEYFIFDTRASDVDAQVDNWAGVLNYDGSFDSASFDNGSFVSANWQYEGQLATLTAEGAIGSDAQHGSVTSASKDSPSPDLSGGKNVMSFSDSAEPEVDEDPLVVSGRRRETSGFSENNFIPSFFSGGGYDFGSFGFWALNFGTISADTPPGVTDTVIQVTGLRATPPPPAIIPPAYNYNWIIGDYDPTYLGDDDGDGIPNGEDVLDVVAPSNPRNLLLANEFAGSKVTEDLFLYGGIVSVAQFDLAGFLKLIGLSEAGANFVTGGIVASTSAQVSVVDYLSVLREHLHELYTKLYLLDIESHPEKYETWILLPGNQLFDASTMDD